MYCATLFCIFLSTLYGVFCYVFRLISCKMYSMYGICIVGARDEPYLRGGHCDALRVL